GPFTQNVSQLPPRVLSTHVEVVRWAAALAHGITCALHARGGGPRRQGERSRTPRCSPRTWRWSVARHISQQLGVVLSTHVEVARREVQCASAGCRALHARGGGP